MKINEVLGTFLERHPDGWGDAEWRTLLSALSAEGHDVSHPAAIGEALEKLRLARTLEELDVRGVGPKRRAHLVEHYGRLWDLRQATAQELAELKALPGKVAKALHAALH